MSMCQIWCFRFYLNLDVVIHGSSVNHYQKKAEVGVKFELWRLPVQPKAAAGTFHKAEPIKEKTYFWVTAMLLNFCIILLVNNPMVIEIRQISK